MRTNNTGAPSSGSISNPDENNSSYRNSNNIGSSAMRKQYEPDHQIGRETIGLESLPFKKILL